MIFPSFGTVLQSFQITVGDTTNHPLFATFLIGFGTANASRERCGETAPVVAATVDFFRKRTYTPALAATAPTFALNPHPHYPVDSCIHHNISRVGSKPAAVDAADAAFPERVRRTDRDGSARTPSMENRAFSRSTWAGEGGCCGDDSPDTEPLVCMLWLQVRKGLGRSFRGGIVYSI